MLALRTTVRTVQYYNPNHRQGFLQLLGVVRVVRIDLIGSQENRWVDRGLTLALYH